MSNVYIQIYNPNSFYLFTYAYCLYLHLFLLFPNHVFIYLFSPAVDPYAVLALLGFLVFLFYIIYNFLNNTGGGRRSFGGGDVFGGVGDRFSGAVRRSTEDLVSENNQILLAAMEKYDSLWICFDEIKIVSFCIILIGGL